MFVVKGELRLKDEGRAEALKAMSTVIAATRAEEDNITYVYAVDVDEPDLVHIYEEWQSAEGMDAHMATPHMAEFMGAIGTAVAGVSIVRYDASNPQKLM